MAVGYGREKLFYNDGCVTLIETLSGYDFIE
jgi:hypothetical protein